MVSFTADREKALDALSFASTYAAPNESIPVLAHALISVRDGVVHVTTTNSDQTARVSFPVDQSGDDGSFCVSAKLLVSALKGSKAAEVSVEENGKSAIIRVGKSKFDLPILPAGAFPAMTMLDADGDCEFVIDGDLLCRLPRELSYAVEDPNGRVALTGISCIVKDGRMEFWAADGMRFSTISIDTPLGATGMGPIIIPPIDMPAWDEKVLVAVSKYSVRFSCEGRILATKLIDAVYPDIHRALPVGVAVKAVFDRAEMVAAVNRVSLISDAKEHSILFVGSNGVITLSAKTTRGEVTDEVPYEGGDFTMAVVRKIALTTMSAFTSETLEIRWKDVASPIIAADPRDERRFSVMAPYRDPRLAAYAMQEAA